MSLSDTPKVQATAPARPLRDWTVRGRSAILLAGVSAVCGIGLAASGVMLVRAAGGAGMLDVIGAAQTKPQARTAKAPAAAAPAAVPKTAVPPATVAAAPQAVQPQAAQTPARARADATPPVNAAASAPPAVTAPAATAGADAASSSSAAPPPASSAVSKAEQVGPAAPAAETSAPAKAAPATMTGAVVQAPPARPAAGGDAARRIAATPAPRSPARAAAVDESLVPVKPLRTSRGTVAARTEPVQVERRDLPGLRAVSAPPGTAANVRAYTLADRTSTLDASGARIIRLDLPTTR